MTFKLTQELTFETDSIDDFAIVLQTIVPIVLDRNCEVETAGSSDDQWPSLTTAWFLSQYNRILECPVETGTCGLINWRRKAGAESLHLPICRLSSADSYGKDRIALTAQEAVKTALQRLQEPEHLKELERRCSRRGVFGPVDGSVRRGFRMHSSSYKGFSLVISLCHMYYSK
jgi:hypothetical protein